jgi:hypothetical protein
MQGTTQLEEMIIDFDAQDVLYIGPIEMANFAERFWMISRYISDDGRDGRGGEGERSRERGRGEIP